MKTIPTEDVINVECEKDKLLISVDTNAVDKAMVLRFIERLRLEFLSQKTNLEIDLNSLGEEIKAEWWNKNKNRLLGENK